MNTQERNRRTQRKARFNLECLDERIVPSPMHAGIGADVGAVAAETAQSPHQRHLAQVAARREARLARIQARHLARLARHASNSAFPATAPVAVNVSSAAAPAAAAPAASGSGSATAATGAPIGTPPNSPIVTPTPPTPTPTPTATPTPTPSPGPLPANVSQPLQELYASFQSSGIADQFPIPPNANNVLIDGANVGVQIHTNDSAGFDSLLDQLKSDGLQVVSSDATHGTIEGMLPIAQLPTVAQHPQTLSVTPMFKAKTM